MSSIILILVTLLFPVDVYASGTIATGEFALPFAFLVISFIFNVFFFIISIYFIGFAPTPNRFQKKILNGDTLDDEKIKTVDSKLSRKEIILSAFDTYRELQYAWSDFRTDDIRNLTSDELYNSFAMQLDALKLKNQKNIMKDIKLFGAGVLKVSKTDKVTTVDVVISVSQLDYVIDNNNRIVRGNKYTRKETYILTLDKISDKKREIKACPNCGGELKEVASQKCKYCSSTIIKESIPFVITKIENVTRLY